MPRHDSPNVKRLVTRRARLRLTGERDFMVSPLANADAVKLFAERAQAIKPEFALTPTNMAAINAICQHLDNLPLAVELAATHIRLLSPTALRTQLQARTTLQVLGDGACIGYAPVEILDEIMDSAHQLWQNTSRFAHDHDSPSPYELAMDSSQIHS